MLQIITDFTIPDSTCNLYYHKLNGQVWTKIFYKRSLEGFYISGDSFGSNGGIRFKSDIEF